MTEMHARLQKAADRDGRSHRAISIAAGLAPGTLGDILKNPDRSPSVRNLTALARTLGVSPSWLIEGRGDNAQGFGERELDAWTPPAKSGERPDLDFARIARLLAPAARHPSTMQIRIDAPGCGLSAGDVLVIDMNATAQAGDIVIAQVADLSSGDARTVIRRYLPPYLVPLDPAGETFVVDGVRISIMGKLAASFRAPQLSDG